ncbi:MAG: carbon-nitrogen hydrolase family protein, partial [bacterium]
GKIGMLICHDLRYPEACRSLVFKGAQIVLVPSAFGKSRVYSWDVQTRARAMENGIFILYANRVGEEPDFAFCGNSRIVNPWGKPVVSLSDSAEGLATAEISLDDIPKAREEIPQLPQVRPHIYRYLASSSPWKDSQVFRDI